MECTVTVNDVEFEASFEISAYTPARLYGAPENCHPEEGGEIEFDYICLDGKDVQNSLSAETIEEIERQCYAYAEKEEDSAANDYYDMLREDREWRYAA